ncbi:MAG: serine hydrolase [Lachnospiraceae bacterium]|nr:serine hydrolase [Lachnospiraceae bacterium]
MEIENREIKQNTDFDDINAHQARRAARLARLREEKRRQERRRRMIKKYLPLGIGAAAILILCIVGICLVVKGKQDKEQLGVYEEQTASAETESSADPAAIESETESAMPQESQMAEEETVKEPETYSFAFTQDTAAIVSEEVISSHAILVDESTDTVIAQKGATERISPASMTKVLTVLTAAELIPEEKLDDTFTMTLEITDYAYVNDCSGVGFLKDEQVTVRDLFYGTILPSGADAAVGLAFYAAGSHEAFVEKMNEKLQELGLAQTTHFTNCVGLYDEAHYSTVYDMAIIMKAAMQNPLCREVLSAHTYTTTPTPEHPDGIVISNWFLRRIEDKDTGGEVIGAKTGFVVQSKNCAVSYGSFAGGTPYICVTAGSSSSWRCIYDHVEIYTRYIP